MRDHSIPVPLPHNLFATIDAEDAERVLCHRWCLTGKGYVHRRRHLNDGPGPNIIYLHRVILDAPPGIQVDHINRNKLNNRRGNLRLATNAQNHGNRGPNTNNTSGFKGVFWSKERAMWVAEIRIADTAHRLGYFANIEDAARAYNDAALAAFGEFAWLNPV